MYIFSSLEEGEPTLVKVVNEQQKDSLVDDLKLFDSEKVVESEQVEAYNWRNMFGESGSYIFVNGGSTITFSHGDT